MPLIIKRFIGKIDNLQGKYIFAVCTNGHGPGISLQYLGEMIRKNDGKLHAGFAVRMRYNYIIPSFTVKNFYSSFTLKEIEAKEQQKMLADWKKKLKIILEYIEQQREGLVETNAVLIEKKMIF